MPEIQKNQTNQTNPKIRTLKASRLERSPRSSDTPPPTDEARRAFGAALARSLKRS